MTELLLPASANWYCSRVVDCNELGILCFGAKHSLYLFEASNNASGNAIQFLSQISAHSDRVVGVSFSKDGCQSTICSAGDDGKVKVWDINTKEMLYEHEEHRSDKGKITVVQWNPADNNIIASASEKGTIVIWQLSPEKTIQLTPDGGHIFSLAFNPFNAHQLAVGYKSGLILVLDVKERGQRGILHRLRGHEDEVHCLCWRPVPGEEINWRTNGESGGLDTSGNLLASSSKDRTLRVWSLSRGRTTNILRLPTNTGQPRRERHEDGANRNRLWVAIHWPKHRPHQIVSSSFNGDLLLWDLAQEGKQKWQVFTGGPHKGHNRIVFNIVPVGADDNSLATISMDRQLMLWDIDSLSPRVTLPTLGGFVYCAVQSPIHPGRLALGVGDNMIRIWNVESPERPYEAQSFWQGIKSKVTTLSWHPQKEGMLAFGTDDGKVATLDVLSGRSQVSSTYHKRTVYVVAWGPACYVEGSGSPGAQFVLYSCGDGIILQHRKMEHDATDVNQIIKQTNSIKEKPSGRSEICWKPDFSMVALGNDDGSIDILSAPHLRLLVSVRVHRQLINCVRWHPEFTAQSDQPSPCRFWIASGSNEAAIQVVDLQKTLDAAKTSSGPLAVTESFCRLEGHTNRITGLTWSCHVEGMLASASYDWTAQVWNVKTAEAIANYREHAGRLLCIAWSGLDPDLLYTGADDFTAQAWRVSAQTHTKPPAGTERKRWKNKGKGRKGDDAARESRQSPSSTASEVTTVGVATTTSLPLGQSQKHDGTPLRDAAKDGGNTGRDVDEIKDLLEKKRVELLMKAEQGGGDANSSDGNTTSQNLPLEGSTEIVSLTRAEIADLLGHEKAVEAAQKADSPAPKKESSKKDSRDRLRKRGRAMFPTSSLQDNRGKGLLQEDCIQLARIKASDAVPDLEDDNFHLGYFLDRKNTYKLFEREACHHLDQGNMDQVAMLDVFKGDIQHTIATATQRGQLSDFILALAAMASPTTWRETCVAYAKQLEADGNYGRSATYLLAAHQVYEAIHVLRRNGQYKDAICLAQARLSPFDPLLKELFTTWASHLAADGVYEMAAKCYLAANQPTEAAKVMSRRADTSALAAAAEISLASGNIQNTRVFAQKYLRHCMTSLDWAAGARFTIQHEDLKLYSMVLAVHQTLVTQLAAINLCPNFKMADAHFHCDVTKDDHKPDEPRLTLPWFMLSVEGPHLGVPWTAHTVDGQAFVHSVLRQWHIDFRLPLDSSVLAAIDTELIVLSHGLQAHTGEAQVLIDLSYYVTMAIVKLLMGKMEASAHWMTIAMATCNDRGLHNLAQGLCCLLLPHGPRYLPRLQQEVRALRTTAVGDHPAPLSVHERRAFAGELSKKEVAKEDDEAFSVSCSDTTGTAYDALQAYYALTALQYLLSRDRLVIDTAKDPVASARSTVEDEEKTSAGGDEAATGKVENTFVTLENAEPVEASPVADAIETQGDGEAKEAATTEDAGTVGGEAVKDATTAESVNVDADVGGDAAVVTSIAALRRTARSLLVDVQLKRLELEEALVQIHRATDGLTSHPEQPPAPPSAAVPTSPSHGALPAGAAHARTPDAPIEMAKVRRISGEYMPMYPPRRRKQGLAVVIPGKPHEEMLKSPVRAPEMQPVFRRPGLLRNPSSLDDYEKMEPESEECSQECRASHHSQHPHPNPPVEPSPALSDPPEAQDGGAPDTAADPASGNPKPHDDVIIRSDNLLNGALTIEGDQGSPAELSPRRSVFHIGDALPEPEDPTKPAVSVTTTGDGESVAHTTAVFDDPNPEPITPPVALPAVNTRGSLQPSDSRSTLTSSFDNIEEEAEDPRYLSVPEDWYNLPIEVKYRHEAMTLDLLLNERTRINETLSEIAKTLKDVPFPHPERSLEALRDLCRKHGIGGHPEQQTFVVALAAWAEDHCFTAKGKALFAYLLAEEGSEP